MRPQVAIINELLAPARAQQDDPDVYQAGSIVTVVLRPRPKLDADLCDRYSPW
jgi:hypothetical protein